ncbi:MAG: NDP-hexose 2,3-dehydratase family protein [Lachnospiraceae bacterium]|nr:NDP-hexose 2,3-dehydratase family protein [Lachnospiraceae bacterium]
MIKNFTQELIRSWEDRKGNVNSMAAIEEWIADANKQIKVNVEKIDFSYSGFWHYDESDGYIRNDNDSFFQIAGYQEIEDDQIIEEQPIIIQDEIGYLGIIVRMIDGTLNFLMQAKIEPGNVNTVQLSPTLQATKSNFTRRHGGKQPQYLDYFVNSTRYGLVADQLESEQSSRFYKKRNRNVILLVEEDIPVAETHRWMTLGQIKELMKQDNLVNMDTRTVLSCLPFDISEIEDAALLAKVQSDPLLGSILAKPDDKAIRAVFNVLNDHRMYRREKSRLLPVKSLKGWKMTKQEIVCRTPYDFKVIYCRIEIENREIRYWEQPMIESIGEAVFGLFAAMIDGTWHYLVQIRHEMGCFDSAELGPTVQISPKDTHRDMNDIDLLFMKRWDKKQGVRQAVLLSEEGGRFYHEQNHNVILEISPKEVGPLPTGYFWLDHATICALISHNNCVNIQLRNLIAIIDG